MSGDLPHASCENQLLQEKMLNVSHYVNSLNYLLVIKHQGFVNSKGSHQTAHYVQADLHPFHIEFYCTHRTLLNSGTGQ